MLNEDNLCFVFCEIQGIVCVCFFCWTRKRMSHSNRYERFKIIIHVIMNKEKEKKRTGQSLALQTKTRTDRKHRLFSQVFRDS